MSEPIYRLGDLIDDYCTRCRLLLNHAVAGMVDGRVVKVVCETCHNEHPYRNSEVPEKKKKAGTRANLFDQVLAKAAAGPPSGGASAEADGGTPASAKKKRPAKAARYITRHRSQPPRGRA